MNAFNTAVKNSLPELGTPSAKIILFGIEINFFYRYLALGLILR
jgi:hypothetical protein